MKKYDSISDINIWPDADCEALLEGGVARKHIRSEYPAWFFAQRVNALADEIRSKENQIDLGFIPKTEVANHQAEIEELKRRLEAVQQKPELTDMAESELMQVEKELGTKIGDALYTKSDMQSGMAPASGEAARMTEHKIGLSNMALGWAKACNVGITGRKVSRTGAEKSWKIARRLLGEEIINPEMLRKD